MSRNTDLWTRITRWARNTHGWDHNIGPGPNNRHPIEARIGPHSGYGRTTHEAINNCADGLIEDGWPDDRDNA